MAKKKKKKRYMIPQLTFHGHVFFRNPQGSILKSETTKDAHAPVVASFSSRGPNSILEDILKVMHQSSAYLHFFSSCAFVTFGFSNTCIS